MPEPDPLPIPVLGKVFTDMVCTECGCLCDDMALMVVGDRIVSADHACERGRSWFLADHSLSDHPVATIDGLPAGRLEAIDRAAEILGRAQAPLITGLIQSSLETQAEAVALADRIGAVVDLAHSDQATPRVLATQRVGSVSATLGEVKNRADLVVFWGVDPLTTHPRHWERYSVFPPGRFVPRGRADRVVLVVDIRASATAEQADDFLSVRPEAEFATLWTMRALVKGLTLDADQVQQSTGIPLDTLERWADRLTQARYGVLFHGSGLSGQPPRRTASVEALLNLVRDLNTDRRFVSLSMGGPGNPAGAEAVLTWQAGYPVGVDFSRGYPRFRPGEATVAGLLARGGVDAALIVGHPDPRSCAQSVLASPSPIPSVLIDPHATASWTGATVGLASSTFGIHAPGTIARSDGPYLPVRPPLTSILPTDRDLLAAIRERLGP